MTNSTHDTGLSRRSVLSVSALAPVLLASPVLLGSASAQSVVTPKGAAIHRRRIGDIEVIALADGFGAMPTSLLTGFEPDKAQAAAADAYKPFDPDMMRVVVNGYLIRSGDRVIAVDAGAAELMGEGAGHWRESLAAAGVVPEQIDTLFLTHPHVDHVGGLSSAQGERYLENAQLVLSEADWDYAHDDAVLAYVPEDFQPMFHAARAMIAPYALDREMLAMTRETEIAPGVTAVPLPGHTPGHMGLRIESGGEAMLIWGDVIHVPAYQFAQPDWSIIFDADAGVAGETRARMLDSASADRLMVAGMHLDFPAVGFVERRGDSYRYITAPVDYRV